jgi:hypothetical protein
MLKLVGAYSKELFIGREKIILMITLVITLMKDFVSN